jgi:hypothetical protein
MQRKSNRKLIAILPDATEHTTSSAEIFPDRIPIEQLRKIWNDKSVQYTDEELQRIREWLYTVAGVIVQVVENNDVAAIMETPKKKRPKRKQPPIIFIDTIKNAA